MHLPPPSDEQKAIVESVVSGAAHVRVDAVAGAGKTTTVLHLAAATEGRLLVLTYNRKLRLETDAKCRSLGVDNVTVHTYHSAALNLYGDDACSRDEGIARLLSTQARAEPCRVASFDVLVVDEAQDMTHLYFRLVRRLIEDVCVPDVRVVVLGDARQSVYAFKGADARFLTLAHRLPFPAGRAWRQHALTTSYRLAPRIANFVNSQLLCGVDLIRSGQRAGKGVVRYLRCNSYGRMPGEEVMRWLASGIPGSEIFVLAPSIRGNKTAVRALENSLVRMGVPCYAPTSDEDRLDDDVTRGKVVFATYHQVKGLERRAVLVMGFDDSYHEFFGRERDAADEGCPNPIYVAATRARLELSVVHDLKRGPMRTVRMDRLSSCCDVRTEYQTPAAAAKAAAAAAAAHAGLQRSGTGERCVSMSVTDLLRHQKPDVLLDALSDLEVVDFGVDHDVPTTTLVSKVSTGGTMFEAVSAITGTAVPCIFEHRTRGRCTLLTRAASAPVRPCGGGAKRNASPLSAEDLRRIQSIALAVDAGEAISTPDFLYVASVHIALTDGFLHKLKQIRVYDWLDDGDVEAMLDVMRRHVKGDANAVAYERPASFDVVVGQRRVTLSCATDCVDSSSRTAFEIKCVSALSTEHTLQTALNALLLEGGVVDADADAHRHVLLNLCDGSTREVVYGDGRGVMSAAVKLLEAKYAAECVESDDAFLEGCRSTVTATVTVTAIASPASPMVSGGEYAFLSDDE